MGVNLWGGGAISRLDTSPLYVNEDLQAGKIPTVTPIEQARDEVNCSGQAVLGGPVDLREFLVWPVRLVQPAENAGDERAVPRSQSQCDADLSVTSGPRMRPKRSYVPPGSLLALVSLNLVYRP
jgi:hypothetical protein